MTTGFSIVARDEVTLDPGRAHLKRLPDLRTDSAPDARSEIADELGVGQMEIAAAFPAVVEIFDGPPAHVLHEAAVLASSLLEAVDEVDAEFRLENMPQSENWRRRGGR